MGMRTLPLRTSHWEVSGSRFLVHKFLLGIPLWLGWCKMTPKCLVDVVHWMVHSWVYHIFLLLTQWKSGPKVMWIERVPSWKTEKTISSEKDWPTQHMTWLTKVNPLATLVFHIPQTNDQTNSKRKSNRVPSSTLTWLWKSTVVSCSGMIYFHMYFYLC